MWSKTRCGPTYAYPRRDGHAELAWVAGYVVRQFTYPKAVRRRFRIDN